MDAKSKKYILEDNVRIRNSEIGNYTWIRVGSYISSSYIGNDVFIGFKCLIYNCILSSNVQIASKTIIGDPHGETVIINKFAWIGVGAEIDAGVTIGEGAVVGAKSKVVSDVPPYSVVVGNPSKVLKFRICKFDCIPDFRNAFEKFYNNQDSEVRLDINKNFITADISAENFKIGMGNILIGKVDLKGGIYIGNNAVMGNNIILEGAGSISIGKNTVINDNVHIVSNSHDYSRLSLPMILSPVCIGNNVIIEEGVTILGNVNIPDGVKVLKNSLIIKSLQIALKGEN